MVCVLATLKVKEEKISEFEEIFIELTGQVRSNEEGNIFYQIAKDREQENTYVVLEHYNNQDSVDAHGKSDHFRAAGAKIGACLDGDPIIKYLDSVK
ncbi:MAG: putative quinol monooxygenase [Pseudomonadota bacterium]|nr:putative quinol monooxygenase [Pseudomonadota bacterium]